MVYFFFQTLGIVYYLENSMNEVTNIPYYPDKWNSLETKKNFFYWKEI